MLLIDSFVGNNFILRTLLLNNYVRFYAEQSLYMHFIRPLETTF